MRPKVVTVPDVPVPPGTLVVGVDDLLVLSFGNVGDDQLRRIREQIVAQFPLLDGRLLIVGGADMAVIKKAELPDAQPGT